MFNNSEQQRAWYREPYPTTAQNPTTISDLSSHIIQIGGLAISISHEIKIGPTSQPATPLPAYAKSSQQAHTYTKTHMHTHSTDPRPINPLDIIINQFPNKGPPRFLSRKKIKILFVPIIIGYWPPQNGSTLLHFSRFRPRTWWQFGRHTAVKCFAYNGTSIAAIFTRLSKATSGPRGINRTTHIVWWNRWFFFSRFCLLLYLFASLRFTRWSADVFRLCHGSEIAPDLGPGIVCLFDKWTGEYSRREEMPPNHWTNQDSYTRFMEFRFCELNSNPNLSVDSISI